MSLKHAEVLQISLFCS